MNWQMNASLAEIETTLAEFQNSHPDIHGWQLEARQSEGRQSLLLGDRKNQLSVYQDRDMQDSTYQLSICVPSDDHQAMGFAKGNLDPNQNLPGQIRTLMNNARQALNPFFTLPDPGDQPYTDVRSADDAIISDLNGAQETLLQRLTRHSAELKDVQVNSAEVYCNRHNHQLITSTGIRVSKQTTDIYTEVAMERQPGPNDQEVLKYWHFVSLDEADLASMLSSVAEETKLTEQAMVPPTRDQATLLVDAYAISKFTAALASRLNAAAEFSQAPCLQPSDRVFTGTKADGSDQLTLSIDPGLPLMASSTPYTDDGLPAHCATVIRDDTVLLQIIHSRMGQYVGKAPNHITGNFRVEPGDAELRELLDQEEVFEILDFSSLLVNPASLTWSSEIKLGRWHRRGQPTRIIKGGIVSGDLKASFGAFRISKEMARRNTIGGYFEPSNGYVGPAYLLTWQGVTIAGQEEPSS